MVSFKGHFYLSSQGTYARVTFTLVHLFNSQLFPSVVIEIQVFINEKSLAFTDEGALKNGHKISSMPGFFWSEWFKSLSFSL